MIASSIGYFWRFNKLSASLHLHVLIFSSSQKLIHFNTKNIDQPMESKTSSPKKNSLWSQRKTCFTDIEPRRDQQTNECQNQTNWSALLKTSNQKSRGQIKQKAPKTTTKLVRRCSKPKRRTKRKTCLRSPQKNKKTIPQKALKKGPLKKAPALRG